MQNCLVKILSLWTIVFLTVPGCGKSPEEKDSNALRVQLQMPSGETQDLFWFGVERKVLQIKGEKETNSYLWASGGSLDIAVEEGDVVNFFGFDKDGRLLVTGEATVGEGKNVSIPLRRVL